MDQTKNDLLMEQVDKIAKVVKFLIGNFDETDVSDDIN